LRESDAHRVVETYLEQGGNFIDTARAYRGSEERIGQVVGRLGCRQEVVICSKSTAADGRQLRRDLERSLRALRTDYLDLYYVHTPPAGVSQMHEILDAFCRLKKEGLIRAVGASIKGPNVTPETAALCRQYTASGKCDVLQVIFSMARRQNARIFEAAAAAGVGIVARTSLENGFLRGKSSRRQTLSRGDHRQRWRGRRFLELLQRVDDLENSLRTKGLLGGDDLPSMTHLALRYVYEEPHVSACIPGASSIAQVESNCLIDRLPALDPEIRRLVAAAFPDSGPSFNLQEHATLRSRLRARLADLRKKIGRLAP
jgi:aryl-alcohol dehydrogenase-like predicted oxidoreductase